MSIDFPCSNCGRTLRTPDDTAGRQAQCPECRAMTTVPSAAAAGGAAAGPAAPLPGGEGPRREEPSMSPFRPAKASSEPATLNPYQSPEQSGVAPTPFGSDQLYAMSKVSGPATAIIVTMAVCMVLQVFGLLINLTRFGVGAAGRHGHQEQMMIGGGVGVAASILGLCVGGLIIYGATKMKNLESYSLAMAASILVMLPCLSPCCLLGIPFGIWALVVLNDPQVRSAFRS